MYKREREKVHCKCTIQCAVHCIITLFKVENILLCVIYQLNLHCCTVLHVVSISSLLFQLMHAID